ncbi:hypothetical protein BD779DRAFT_1470148 [Infundibulicybe gibba]|nr:hypothetical protein BD779DRAFT_1470148 [Infundibulicybe gibba]
MLRQSSIGLADTVVGTPSSFELYGGVDPTEHFISNSDLDETGTLKPMAVMTACCRGSWRNRLAWSLTGDYRLLVVEMVAVLALKWTYCSWGVGAWDVGKDETEATMVMKEVGELSENIQGDGGNEGSLEGILCPWTRKPVAPDQIAYARLLGIYPRISRTAFALNGREQTIQRNINAAAASAVLNSAVGLSAIPIRGFPQLWSSVQIPPNSGLVYGTYVVLWDTHTSKPFASASASASYATKCTLIGAPTKRASKGTSPSPPNLPADPSTPLPTPTPLPRLPSAHRRYIVPYALNHSGRLRAPEQTNNDEPNGVGNKHTQILLSEKVRDVIPSISAANEGEGFWKSSHSPRSTGYHMELLKRSLGHRMTIAPGCCLGDFQATTSRSERHMVCPYTNASFAGDRSILASILLPAPSSLSIAWVNSEQFLELYLRRMSFNHLRCSVVLGTHATGGKVDVTKRRAEIGIPTPRTPFPGFRQNSHQLTGSPTP